MTDELDWEVDMTAAMETVADFMGCGVNHARLHVETFRRWLGKYTGIPDIVFSPKDSITHWRRPDVWTASWRDRTGDLHLVPSEFPEWIETPLILLGRVDNFRWRVEHRLEQANKNDRKEKSNGKSTI